MISRMLPPRFHQRNEIFGAFDRRPINLAVAADDAHSLVARESHVDVANRPQKRLVDRAFPHLRICRVPPNGGELSARHRQRVENEAVEQILMHRIRHLHNDGAHRFGKSGMANDRDAELVVEVAVMILPEAHDVSRIPRTEDLGHHARVSLRGLTSRRIGPRKERDEREGGRPHNAVHRTSVVVRAVRGRFPRCFFDTLS
jgi:hypothetical protein